MSKGSLDGALGPFTENEVNRCFRLLENGQMPTDRYGLQSPDEHWRVTGYSLEEWSLLGALPSAFPSSYTPRVAYGFIGSMVGRSGPRRPFIVNLSPPARGRVGLPA